MKKKSAKMSQSRPKRTRFSVEEVLHELVLDSENDDEPSSFDSSYFGWIIVYYTVCMHTKIWKRSVEKYKSYETLSKTTHFLSMFCEAGVFQQ